MVCYDHREQRPIPLPDTWRDTLNTLIISR